MFQLPVAPPLSTAPASEHTPAWLPADGFVPLQALLRLPQFHSFSIEDVQRVVDNNGKQRFALRPGEPSTGPLIRANQGHSLQVGTRGHVRGRESQVGPQFRREVSLLPIHTLLPRYLSWS